MIKEILIATAYALITGVFHLQMFIPDELLNWITKLHIIILLILLFNCFLVKALLVMMDLFLGYLQSFSLERNN